MRSANSSQGNELRSGSTTQWACPFVQLGVVLSLTARVNLRRQSTDKRKLNFVYSARLLIEPLLFSLLLLQTTQGELGWRGGGARLQSPINRIPLGSMMVNTLHIS